MRCKKCNYENKDEFQFCQKCGTKLENEPSIFCPKCGKENDFGMSFCRFCGSKLIPEEKKESKVKEETIKQGKKESFILCPKCGKENKESTKFCLSCGEKLVKEESKKEERAPEKKLAEEKKETKVEEATKQEEVKDFLILCPKCGKENKEGTKFCLSCGEKLVKEESKKEERAPEKKLAEEKKETKVEEATKQEEVKDFLILCPKCGKENKEGTKFCLSCGEKLIKEEPKKEEKVEEKKVVEEKKETKVEEEIIKQEENKSSIRCPKCGRVNNKSQKFCLSCGTKLNQEIPQSQIKVPEQKLEENKTMKPKKKKRKFGKFLLFLFLMAMIAIGVYGGYQYITYKIPNIDGLTEEEAVALLQENHFEVTIEETDQSEISFKNQSNILEIILRKSRGILYVPSDEGWSEWMTELPEDIDEENYQIQTRTEYRSRNKETKTSSEKLNDKEWTLDKEEKTYSDWEKVTYSKEQEESDTLKLSNTTTVYVYYHYENTYRDGTTGVDSIVVNRGIRKEIETNMELEKAPSNVADKGGRGADARISDIEEEEALNIWWFDHEEKTYIYDKREVIDTKYIYAKYSDWGEYQSKKIEESDTVDVEVRTVYRYKEK